MKRVITSALFLFALGGCTEHAPGVIDPGDALFSHGSATMSDWTAAPAAPFANVNTPNATEGCPFVTRSEHLLVFASNRTGGFGALDLYVAYWDASAKRWGEPVNMGASINTSANEQCPLLSANGKELIFVSNRPGGAGGLDLWVARRGDNSSDFDWDPAVNLGAVNTSANEFGPGWYEERGRTVLYFNSNRPDGGANTHDLYVSVADRDGVFGPASPAEGLNTEFEEQFASVSRDGLEIFFSSNRPGGYGSLDLWRATRPSTSSPWDTPVNLGPRVNSSAAEGRSAISWDGTTLYFHSNRNGSVDLFQSSRNRGTGRIH